MPSSNCQQSGGRRGGDEREAGRENEGEGRPPAQATTPGPPRHRHRVGARPEAEDLVARQLDAVRHPRRVEHEDVAVALAFGVGSGEHQPAHLHALALVGPGDRGVVHLVALGGQHHQQAEGELVAGQAVLLQVVDPPRLGLVALQHALAGLGLEAVAQPARAAVGRDPAVGVDRVERAGGVALRRGGADRGLDRRQRLGVGAEPVGHQPLGVLARLGEAQEVLRGAHEEAGQGEADQVRLAAVRQVELDRQAAALGGVVGDDRVAAAVGEAGGHAHRLALHVRGRGQRGGPRRGREGAGQQGPLGVRGAVAGVRAGDRVDGVHHLLGEGVRLGGAGVHAFTIKPRAPRRSARAASPVRRPCDRRGSHNIHPIVTSVTRSAGLCQRRH